ncbi:MAG: hypothetical protein SangKO_075220 [Sandaracinaceae bacterium]
MLEHDGLRAGAVVEVPAPAMGWLELSPLRCVVDAPRTYASTNRIGFDGYEAIDGDASIRLVHLVGGSGEFLGFVITEDDGQLRRRWPIYGGPWPAMEAATAELTETTLFHVREVAHG